MRILQGVPLHRQFTKSELYRSLAENAGNVYFSCSPQCFFFLFSWRETNITIRKKTTLAKANPATGTINAYATRNPRLRNAGIPLAVHAPFPKAGLIFVDRAAMR